MESWRAVDIENLRAGEMWIHRAGGLDRWMVGSLSAGGMESWRAVDIENWRTGEMDG